MIVFKRAQKESRQKHYKHSNKGDDCQSQAGSCSSSLIRGLITNHQLLAMNIDRRGACWWGLSIACLIRSCLRSITKFFFKLCILRHIFLLPFMALYKKCSKGLFAIHYEKREEKLETGWAKRAVRL